MIQEFEGLGDYEEAQSRNVEAYRAYVVATDALVRQPASPRLLEVVAQTAQSDEPVRWLHELTVTPALGKAMELRALMRERDKSLDAQGRRTMFAVQVAPGDYGLLVRTFQYPSLAALDEQRHRNTGSPEEREHVAQENALIGRLTQSAIWELLPAE